MTPENAVNDCEAASSLEHALEYAKNGFAVLPLAAGAKVPTRDTRGVKDATTDAHHLRRRWPSPRANVGVATGPVSGIWALDVDPRHDGIESLKELAAQRGGLPKTASYLTPSGGVHLWFGWPGATRVGNSAGRIGSGLDVRGEGGYVVVPPSRLDSGDRYDWRRPAGVVCPDRGQIAAAPAWLLELVGQDPEPEKFAPPIEGKIGDGTRNVALTSLAGTVRGRGCEADEIYALIAAANARRCDPPLSDREVQAIVRSVMRYPPDRAWWAAGEAEDRMIEEWVLEP